MAQRLSKEQLQEAIRMYQLATATSNQMGPMAPYQGMMPSNSYVNQKPPKKSGAKAYYKDGKISSIKAWAKTKMGLMTLSAVPIERIRNTRVEVQGGTSRKGQQWETWQVWFKERETDKERMLNAFWYPQEQKLRIPDIGMVASCSTSIRGVTSSGKSVTGAFVKMAVIGKR